MTRQWLASIAVASASLVGPALAADIPVKAPDPPAFSWNGCYAGGNVGGIGDRETVRLSPTGTYLAPAGAAGDPNAAGTGALAGDLLAVTDIIRSTSSGFAGGGEVGCNWQFYRGRGYNLVVGFEGDIDGTRLAKTSNRFFGAFASADPGFTVSPRTESLTQSLSWYSTFRARVGLARDHWLLYATGGLALAGFESDTYVVFGSAGALPVFGGATHVGSREYTAAGAVAGAGFEYAFNNQWSAKIEYLYMSFWTASYLSPLIAPGGVAPGYAWSTGSGNLGVQTVRVGLHYRFRTW